MNIKCFDWFLHDKKDKNKPNDIILTGKFVDSDELVTVIIEGFLFEYYISVDEKHAVKGNINKIMNILKDNNLLVNHCSNELPDLLNKKSLYGYKPMFCYKLLANNISQLNIAQYVLSKYLKNCSGQFYYETNHLLKFWVKQDITPLDVVKIIDAKKVSETVYKVKWDCVRGHSDNQLKEYNFKTFYFDIECESLKDVENDDFDDKEFDGQTMQCMADNNIFQISVFIAETATKKTKKYLLTLYPVNDIKDTIIYKLDTQKELIEKFFHLIKIESPDILSGFRIVEFDWPQILKSCNRLNILQNNIDKDEYDMFDGDLEAMEKFKIYKDKELSKSMLYEPKIIKKQYETDDLASNKFLSRCLYYPKFQGRINLDVYNYVEKYYNLPINTLNYVSEKFINENKKDVDYIVLKYISMFCRKLYIEDIDDKTIDILLESINIYNFIPLLKQFYNNAIMCKNSELGYDRDKIKVLLKDLMTVIGEYCIQDSELCYRLFEKLTIQNSCEQMANYSFMTTDDSLYYGNQKKISSIMYKECTENDIILTYPEGFYDLINKSSQSSISGAIVFEPNIGRHSTTLVLDFQSLYPTILVNKNLCFTTALERCEIDSFDNVNEIDTPVGKFYFSNQREGILPKICKYLLSKRKEIKTKMKSLDSKSFEYKLLDSKQKSLKIIANSIYGSMAYLRQKRKYIPIAICITSVGRSLLNQVREIIQDEFDHEVIYGDTDSNMVKLKNKEFKPKQIYDLEQFKNDIETYSEFNVLNDDYKDYKLYTKYMSVDKLKKLIKSEYDFKDSEKYIYEIKNNNSKDHSCVVFDVKSCIENYVNSVGLELSKNVTRIINERNNMNLLLEYETAFRTYLITAKKNYAGLTYSNDLEIKGFPTVRRNYATIEKEIFNNILYCVLYNPQNLKNVIRDEYINLFSKEHEDKKFIHTTSFKSFRHYAKCATKNIFFDKDDNTFQTNEKYDSRFVFPTQTLGLKLALKKHHRGDIVNNNERIEYIYIQNPVISECSNDTTNISDLAIDYETFKRFKNFYKINRLIYLYRIENYVNNITRFNINNTTRIHNLNSLEEKIAKINNLQIIPIWECLKIKIDKKFLVPDSVKQCCDLLNLSYKDIDKSVIKTTKNKITQFYNEHDSVSILLENKKINDFKKLITKHVHIASKCQKCKNSQQCPIQDYKHLKFHLNMKMNNAAETKSNLDFNYKINITEYPDKIYSTIYHKHILMNSLLKKTSRFNL